MMSSRSLFTVIAVTVTMVYLMPQHDVKRSDEWSFALQMYDIFTTIHELMDKEYFQAHAACATELNAFGYDGRLHHDTHYFDFKTVFSAKSLPGYRAFVDYIDDKIFSTNTSLVDTYCDSVEILFEKGFTGALPIDKAISEKEADKEKTEIETKYISFVTSKPYSEIKEKTNQLIFDLVYEYGLGELEPTEEGAECKTALGEQKYTGNFVNDLVELRKINPKYEGLLVENDDASIVEKKAIYVYHYNKFMVYAKDYVLFTDNNVMNVFCDLLEPLKLDGFKGEKDHDMKKFEAMPDTHKLKEEATIYNGYLVRVIPEVYISVDKKVPKSLLGTFGLHKLGKIMY